MLGCFIGSYVYFNPDTSTKLDLPFFKDVVLNLGIFYIPFVALVVIGTSNAVNLTDGLDGLAGNQAAVAFAAYGIIASVQGQTYLTVFCFV